ncbi:MAG: RluA family pseudouridine synthase [Myxococcales bacterium]|jgi:23S rRNA pseudouridine1911/1915/1917 synthase
MSDTGQDAGQDAATPERVLEVPAAAEGERLDRFVTHACPELGRAAVRRLIGAGQVRVDGRSGVAGLRLSQGQRVTLRDFPAGEAAVADPSAPLSVLHEDDFIVVVDKPPGVASHPLRPGEGGTLASALLARYPEMAAVGFGPREPGLLHRLDTNTSGLLLAARDTETFEALRAVLADGGVDKRYLALCAGEVRAPALHRAFLSALGPRVTVRAEAFREAVEIETEVLSAEPACTGSALSLAEMRVHVARRHQVRAHLAMLGHPIAGDAQYGGPALPGLSRHFLHASRMAFDHPRRPGVRIEVRAELPADLRAVLDGLTGS